MKMRIGVLLLLWVVGPVSAADRQSTVATKPQGNTLEQRIMLLERSHKNQNLADLVVTLQRLQQEVQQLRGEVELQNHTMDALKKQQRDLYLDLDGRIGRLQMTPPVVPAAPVVPQPVVAAQPVVAPPPVMQQPVEPVIQGAAGSADPALEESTYQAAFNQLKQGRYGDAIVAFKQFLLNYPDGGFADNAQYWLGEASYVKRDFNQSLVDFDRLLQRYPGSPKVRGALLKSGYIHYEQKSWQQARSVLQRLVDSYPASSEARLAKKRLQRMSKEQR